MEELISMIVANGLWAALFCILLGYELRDSRKRESKYTHTIETLSARLETVNDVRSDTRKIKSDTQKISADTEQIRLECVRRGKRGGAVCASQPQ